MGAFTTPRESPSPGFLAGYRGLTREAYVLDLRQFASWSRTRSLALFAVRRADIESFARELEAMGRARATVTRLLSTIAGIYKFAVEEELLDRSPAAHVRRPRVDYESHAVAVDRNELGALLVAAGLGPPAGHALISLLAMGLTARARPEAPVSTWWSCGYHLLNGGILNLRGRRISKEEALWGGLAWHLQGESGEGAL